MGGECSLAGLVRKHVAKAPQGDGHKRGERKEHFSIARSVHILQSEFVGMHTNCEAAIGI